MAIPPISDHTPVSLVANITKSPALLAHSYIETAKKVGFYALTAAKFALAGGAIVFGLAQFALNPLVGGMAIATGALLLAHTIRDLTNTKMGSSEVLTHLNKTLDVAADTAGTVAVTLEKASDNLDHVAGTLDKISHDVTNIETVNENVGTAIALVTKNVGLIDEDNHIIQNEIKTAIDALNKEDLNEQKELLTKVLGNLQGTATSQNEFITEVQTEMVVLEGQKNHLAQLAKTLEDHVEEAQLETAIAKGEIAAAQQETEKLQGQIKDAQDAAKELEKAERDWATKLAMTTGAATLATGFVLGPVAGLVAAAAAPYLIEHVLGDHPQEAAPVPEKEIEHSQKHRILKKKNYASLVIGKKPKFDVDKYAQALEEKPFQFKHEAPKPVLSVPIEPQQPKAVKPPRTFTAVRLRDLHLKL